MRRLGRQDLAVTREEAEKADRAEHEGQAMARAEELRREIARGEPGQHALPQAIAAKSPVLAASVVSAEEPPSI